MKSKTRKKSDFHKNSFNSIIIDNKKIGRSFLFFFPLVKAYRILKFRFRELTSKKNKFFYLYYNHNIKVNLSRQISNNFYLNKNMNEYYDQKFVVYEPIESWVVNKYSKKNNFFFDIGSHQGYFAYIASKNCSEIHVFEPLSNFYDEINYHINLNKIENIHLHKQAIGNGEYIEYGNFLEIKKVKTIKLDDFLNNFHSKDSIFMKIDVDGFEINLLSGFNKYLSKENVTILIDVYLDRIDENECLKQIKKLLKIFKEDSFIIDKSKKLTTNIIDNSIFVPLSVSNISVLKNSKINSLFFGKI